MTRRKKPVETIAEVIAEIPAVKSGKKRKPYNKYHNIKSVDEDGNKWDSAWEREVWGVLIDFQKSGAIKDLQRQVRIQLHSPFIDNEGKFHLKKLCVYIADFTYFLKDDTYVIADAKSERTLKDSTFRLKSKMVTNETGSPIKIFMKGKPITI